MLFHDSKDGFAHGAPPDACAAVLVGFARLDPGDLILSPGSRDALQQGRVYLAVVTTSRPSEPLRAQLSLR
jgi:hypothetical protein